MWRGSWSVPVVEGHKGRLDSWDRVRHLGSGNWGSAGHIVLVRVVAFVIFINTVSLNLSIKHLDLTRVRVPLAAAIGISACISRSAALAIRTTLDLPFPISTWRSAFSLPDPQVFSFCFIESIVVRSSARTSSTEGVWPIGFTRYDFTVATRLWWDNSWNRFSRQHL